MVKYHLSLLIACLTISGCSGFKAFEYHVSQTKRVKDAWKTSGLADAGADYKDGWQTGYYDLSMGSDGQVPPVPPKKYWNSKYQNPVGQQLISDWYAGYQDGVIAAERVGEFEWQLVPSSGVAALPSATIVDYPTHYSSPHGGENELPDPHPSVPSANTDPGQLHRPLQQPSNDAVAAAQEPALDLRTFTGRPAVQNLASRPDPQRAIPAPPAPSRIFERVPQPARQWPMVTDAQETDQPTARLNQPRPAISPEQYLASQPARMESPRREELPDLPRRHIEDVQPRNSAVTSDEVPRRSPAIVVNQQMPANSIANIETNEPAPVVTPRSISDQPPIVAERLDTEAKPTESKLHREQVVIQQPTPAAASHSVTPHGAPVVTPNPTVVRQFDARDESITRDMKVNPQVAISKPATKITPAIPEPEFVAAAPADAHWAAPRKSEPENEIGPRPQSTLAEIVDVPTARTHEPSTMDPVKAAIAPAKLEPTEATIAKSNATKDKRIDDVAAAPHHAGEPALARPARTHRPIVVAARPILVATEFAANRTQIQTVEPANAPAPLSAGKAVAKHVSERIAPDKTAQASNPDKAGQSLPTSKSQSVDPLVKMAAPFQLDSSDDPTKPIVLLARPVPLSGASTTRR
ncbi:MAG: hypothetical protein ABI614_10225 [Planctomycetota bacterium]